MELELYTHRRNGETNAKVLLEDVSKRRGMKRDQMRNPLKIMILKHQKKRHSGNKGVEGMIILKRVSEKGYEALDWCLLVSLGFSGRRC
jgi:hypothetical protein